MIEDTSASNNRLTMPDIGDETTSRLRRYADLLAEANGRARLVGPRDAETIYSTLIEDALYGLPLFSGVRSFADIGTGGGIPGAVIAMCRPDISALLIDSIAKKTVLLTEIASQLGASNITVLNARSETAAADRREQLDAATARAVAPAPILAELLSPFVRPGGRVIAYKGRSARDECRPADGKWGKLGLSAPKFYDYSRGDDERSFCIVVWKKISKTPSAYPRRPGDADKAPWYARS